MSPIFFALSTSLLMESELLEIIEKITVIIIAIIKILIKQPLNFKEKLIDK